MWLQKLSAEKTFAGILAKLMMTNMSFEIKADAQLSSERKVYSTVWPCTFRGLAGIYSFLLYIWTLTTQREVLIAELI